MMLTNGAPNNLKGKAVGVQHYLFDELWNMGPKKIPEQIRLNKQEGAVDGQVEEVKESDQAAEVV